MGFYSLKIRRWFHQELIKRREQVLKSLKIKPFFKIKTIKFHRFKSNLVLEITYENGLNFPKLLEHGQKKVKIKKFNRFLFPCEHPKRFFLYLVRPFD